MRVVDDERSAAIRRGYADLLVDGEGDEVAGPEAAAVGVGADLLLRFHNLNHWLDGRDLIDADGTPLPAMALYTGLANAVGRAIERVATLAEARRQRGKGGGPTLSEYVSRFAAADTDDTTDAGTIASSEVQDLSAAEPGTAHSPTHDSATHDAPGLARDAHATEPGIATAPTNDAPSEAAELPAGGNLSDPNNATTAGTSPADDDEEER